MLLPMVPAGASTPADTFPNTPITHSTPVTPQPMPSSINELLAANISPTGGLVNVVSTGSCGPSGATSMSR